MWRGAAYIFFMTGLKGRGVIHLACTWVYLTSYTSLPHPPHLFISCSSFSLSYPSNPLFLILLSSFLNSPFSLLIFPIAVYTLSFPSSSLPYSPHPLLVLSSIPSLFFLFFLSSPCSLSYPPNPLLYPHLFSYFLILHFPYSHHHSHPPLFFILPSCSCHPPLSPSLSISSSHPHLLFLFSLSLHPFLLPVLSTYFLLSSWLCLRILKLRMKILRISKHFFPYT